MLGARRDQVRSADSVQDFQLVLKTRPRLHLIRRTMLTLSLELLAVLLARSCPAVQALPMSRRPLA